MGLLTKNFGPTLTFEKSETGQTFVVHTDADGFTMEESSGRVMLYSSDGPIALYVPEDGGWWVHETEGPFDMVLVSK